MVIVPIMSPPGLAARVPVQDTEGITQQMGNVSMEPKTQTSPMGTSVRITVPLDASSRPAVAASSLSGARKLPRRDSMDRREALLKGNEGSRQRRRWENGE